MFCLIFLSGRCNYLQLISECKYLTFYYSSSEKEKYIEDWSKKTTDSVTGYTLSEYKLYVSIYLENQSIVDIQKEHYLDTGCACNECSKKRNMLYQKLKLGKVDSIEKVEHVEKVKRIIKPVILIKKNKKEWNIKYF